MDRRRCLPPDAPHDADEAIGVVAINRLIDQVRRRLVLAACCLPMRPIIPLRSSTASVGESPSSWAARASIEGPSRAAAPALGCMCVYVCAWVRSESWRWRGSGRGQESSSSTMRVYMGPSIIIIIKADDRRVPPAQQGYSPLDNLIQTPHTHKGEPNATCAVGSARGPQSSSSCSSLSWVRRSAAAAPSSSTPQVRTRACTYALLACFAATHELCHGAHDSRTASLHAQQRQAPAAPAAVPSCRRQQHHPPPLPRRRRPRPRRPARSSSCASWGGSR